MILSGVVASSGGNPQVIATGGSQVVDFGGYRHHIFNSSGSFNVTGGSDPIIVTLRQGGSGAYFEGVYFETQWYGGGVASNRGGNGDRSSLYIATYHKIHKNVSPGSYAVTVGAGGPPGSINGGSTDASLQGQISGTYNGNDSYNVLGGSTTSYVWWNDPTGFSSSSNPGERSFQFSLPVDGQLVNLNTIYPSQYRYWGGGGGGGGTYAYVQYNNTTQSRGPTSTRTGSGAGGTASSNGGTTAGGNAPANLSGGGGSAGATYRGFNDGNYYISRESDGAGGSGLAIISYRLLG